MGPQFLGRGQPSEFRDAKETFRVTRSGVTEAALPDEGIFGLGMYKKKADVIVDRMEAGGYDSGATHFFEDRWPTLAKCLADDRLEGVKLYLCSWGYVTDAERALAEAEPRVEVIGLDDFASIVSSKK